MVVKDFKGFNFGQRIIKANDVEKKIHSLCMEIESEIKELEKVDLSTSEKYLAILRVVGPQLDAREISLRDHFPERHDHVQSIRRAALKQNDELLLVRHRRRRHCALQKRGHRA